MVDVVVRKVVAMMVMSLAALIAEALVTVNMDAGDDGDELKI